ncbi:TetR/AcrR family transcriptional regulator [Amycolatopsis nigrescens]|uniref:TetR/AcrR family transcriptional regulator n=1 Tax=Amycolatopsis nigrescens TaxID=381445 RepID=UPI00036EA052|nr:TetR/AcrR family transcriptional regulator C-terminal domain-containing protein [Amycolatopsis nigrescens]
MSEARSETKVTRGSVWLRQPRTPRDESPLTRARIVEEAVALLDSEGIERLTMRRLAERLGHGSTTLYWHVNTKDDVLDLCLDAIFGEVPLPPEHGEHWRADVSLVLTGWRATMLRHPWSTTLVGRPMIGPNILARMEFLQATLVRAGFGKEHLAAVTWGLYNHVMGSAVARAGWHMQPEERAVAQEHLNAQSERYPTLAAQGYMLDDDWDGTFTQSLNYLLDGIEAKGVPATS